MTKILSDKFAAVVIIIKCMCARTKSLTGVAPITKVVLELSYGSMALSFMKTYCTRNIMLTEPVMVQVEIQVRPNCYNIEESRHSTLLPMP